MLDFMPILSPKLAYKPVAGGGSPAKTSTAQSTSLSTVQFGSILTYKGEDKGVVAKTIVVKPKPSRFLYGLVSVPMALYRRFMLGIKHVEIQGADPVKKLLKEGQRVILAVNHPGHGDAFVLMPLSRELDVPFCMMSVDWVFKMLPMIPERWRHGFLARLGIFPVNQDITDKEAIRTAKDVVLTGDFPLGICPEGAISWQNEKIADLNMGTTSIGCDAAETLAEKGSEKQVFVVPVGIKHRFTRDIIPALEKRIRKMEKTMGVTSPKETSPAADAKKFLPLAQRTRALWTQLLIVKEKEFLGKAEPLETLEAYHPAVLDRLLSRLESDLGLVVQDLDPNKGAEKTKTSMARVRRIFGHLRTGKPIPGQTFKNDKARNQYVQKHFVVPCDFIFKLQKVSPEYLPPASPERLTQERVAEILYVVERLYHGDSNLMTSLSARQSDVSIGAPINLSEMNRQVGRREARYKASEILKSRLQGLVTPNQK